MIFSLSIVWIFGSISLINIIPLFVLIGVLPKKHIFDIGILVVPLFVIPHNALTVDVPLNVIFPVWAYKRPKTWVLFANVIDVPAINIPGIETGEVPVNEIAAELANQNTLQLEAPLINVIVETFVNVIAELAVIKNCALLLFCASNIILVPPVKVIAELEL